MGQPPFVRYPSIPHLREGAARADKVLSSEQIKGLLQNVVSVEEKVDGANIGVSCAAGNLRVQHRGNYVAEQEWHLYPRLQSWLAEHRLTLEKTLGESLILFGEWCVLRHSVRYNQLPDWLLVFDVFDRSAGRFWARTRRDLLASRLAINTVPLLAEDRLDFDGLRSLLGPSRLGDESMEGIVVRRDDDDFKLAAAKLVRPDFLQDSSSHWRSRPPEHNTLRSPE